MLRACHDLKILATSRQSLGVIGEVTCPVPVLPVPPLMDGSASRPDDADKGFLSLLMEYESLRLFVDRAQAVSPGFRLSRENAPVVMQICRELDGIPLAIELAAARMKALSAQDILERLDGKLRLLSGGNRAALPHHQSLRALIDWSYQLLTDDEKRLLRRLSVFAGGWSLSAASEIAFAGSAPVAAGGPPSDGLPRRNRPGGGAGSALLSGQTNRWSWPRRATGRRASTCWRRFALMPPSGSTRTRTPPSSERASAVI